MTTYIKTEHPEYGEVARKECPNPDCGCSFAEIVELSKKTTKTYFECCECGTKFMDGLDK